MSASVTVRVPVSTASPISSSSKCLRNGWTSVSRRGAPAIQVPVTLAQGGGRALQGRALHVVQDTADAAHLLAAAGAAGAAVDQGRERRAVAGRFLAAVAVDDQQAAVIGGDAQRPCRGRSRRRR